MRACEMQIVRHGIIYCEGDGKPCTCETVDEKNKLVHVCPDICEPADGTKWAGVL